MKELLDKKVKKIVVDEDDLDDKRVSKIDKKITKGANKFNNKANGKGKTGFKKRFKLDIWLIVFMSINL